MKNYRLKFLFLIGLLLSLAGCSNSVYKNEVQDWTIVLEPESKVLTISYKKDKILEGVVSRYKLNDQYIVTSKYPVVSSEVSNVEDKIGKGKKVVYSYSGLENYPDVHQIFYFYEGQPQMLAELQLVSKDAIASNYIAPIYTDEAHSFLKKDSANRVLTVPFDNDNFVSYLSNPLTVEDTSSEVTAFFNGENRQGLIIGSVEHDTWKTGIHFSTSENNIINKLEAFGGLANELTRDFSDREDRPSCEHGYVKGNTVKSPKLFIGYFADWRRGLEAYGETCAKIAPPRKWAKGTPFGWNSWAAMASKVNYEGSIDVSDFFKSSLQSNNFSNDNIVYIGLDSFWDNFTPQQLKEFVEHCHKNGQKAGIYWCPFSDWHGNGEAFVEGTDNKWKYKDIYLYAPNGKPRKVESLAVDPTHPGTKMRMDHYINMFKDLGYEYLSSTYKCNFLGADNKQ